LDNVAYNNFLYEDKNWSLNNFINGSEHPTRRLPFLPDCKRALDPVGDLINYPSLIQTEHRNVFSKLIAAIDNICVLKLHISMHWSCYLLRLNQMCTVWSYLIRRNRFFVRALVLFTGVIGNKDPNNYNNLILWQKFNTANETWPRNYFQCFVWLLKMSKNDRRVSAARIDKQVLYLCRVCEMTVLSGGPDNQEVENSLAKQT